MHKKLYHSKKILIFFAIISIVVSCKGEEVKFLSVEELHSDFTGSLQKFVLSPINLQEPEKNNVTYENFMVNVAPGSGNTGIVIAPRNQGLGNSFNAQAEMIFSGGFLNVPTQSRGDATISSSDGGLYVHNLRKIRYTIRVEKGDSTYLEVFEGVKPR